MVEDTVITPPICIGERWDFDFFPSVAAAEVYVEPWFAEEDYVAFDAAGGPLQLNGRGPRRLEITLAGPPDPAHAAELLRRYVQAAGPTGLRDPRGTLGELFAACIKRGGWTYE